jgi:Cu/Ag efflux protein CusF
MIKAFLTFLALLLPMAVNAAELKGTILKVDKTENRIVLKTERGEETFELTKATKGIEHVKVGAKVTISFSEKDGQPKVTEIHPGG